MNLTIKEEKEMQFLEKARKDRTLSQKEFDRLDYLGVKFLGDEHLKDTSGYLVFW